MRFTFLTCAALVAGIIPLVWTTRSAADPISPNEIRVGLLLSLTGPYAPLGEDCSRGIAVARKLFSPQDIVDRYHLNYLFADSQSDPKLGVTEFKRLVDTNHVQAVITLRSPIGMALNPLSNRYKIPLLGAVGHNDFAKNNLFAFQMWPSTDDEGKAFATAMISSGQKRIALFTTEDEWMDSVSERFREHFTALGGSLVVDESVTADTTDFTTFVTKLKVRPVDAVFVNLSIAQVGLMLKKIREQKINPPRYSTYWVAKPEVITSAGVEAVEGVQFIETSTNHPKLASELKSLYGDNHISGMIVSCFSAGALLLQSLKQSAGVDDIYSALLKTSEIQLLDTTVPVRNRQGKYPLALKRIEKGEVRELFAITLE